MTRHTRWAAALAVALAACAGPTPAATDEPPGRELRVGLDEYEVRVSHASVLPDVVTLKITNVGREAHDLRVDGPGEPVITDTLAPGEATTVEVDASRAGELVLWCTLPGHRSQGMATTLSVTSPDDHDGEVVVSTVATLLVEADALSWPPGPADEHAEVRG